MILITIIMITVFVFVTCFGDIPHDVTAWTIPDTINSDWLDKRGKASVASHR